MIKLRDYQAELIANIRSDIRAGHRNVLAVLPTGGGKTVIASALADATSKRGQGIFFICHRDFLVHQTALTFENAGLDFGFVTAGRKMLDRSIMICSIDTLKNRLEKLDVPQVIVWDEAHHLRAAGWMRVHGWTGENINIGLTATPERLDGKGLNPPFTTMVLGPTTAQLMAWGMLSQYRAFAPSAPDLSQVRTIAGEYSQADLEKAMRESVIMGDVVGTYQEKAPGRRAVYFCPDIAYSQDLAAAFRKAGINALHIDGETPSAQRVQAAVDFAENRLDVLTNCALFGEGYDLAAQAQRDVTIDCVGLVRPTQSLTLHRQQIGRGLRPKDYPCIILDHAGNIDRHGLPDDDIEWSLEGRPKEARKVTTKMCPVCSCMNPAHEKRCIECGSVLAQPTGPRGGPEVVEDIQLKEVDYDAHREKRRRQLEEESRCQNLEDFINLGKQRGYKSQWAYIAWQRAKSKVEAQAAAYMRDYQPTERRHGT
jgi:DNA repair protein RadD